MHEFVPQRTAACISQHDVHIGELTVRETLAFFARCQVVGSRYEMLAELSAELSRREKAANIKPDMRDRVLICCGEFTAFDKAQMVIPVKSKHDDDDNRSGGAIQLSTRGSSSGHRTPIGDVTHLVFCFGWPDIMLDAKFHFAFRVEIVLLIVLSILKWIFPNLCSKLEITLKIVCSKLEITLETDVAMLTVRHIELDLFKLEITL
ncbi:hypothetical protein Ddye_001094 [Dipteronia dyeriana]|uniref:Uncharacterized protein n=1 Tax=Dipteronia dyeriana TaxID=168575 RepID=A0AAD9XN90_9ROSI|nr:hypothetical protein Ddye_001094 [Dipteronia dyeriana]